MQLFRYVYKSGSNARVMAQQSKSSDSRSYMGVKKLLPSPMLECSVDKDATSMERLNCEV